MPRRATVLLVALFAACSASTTPTSAVPPRTTPTIPSTITTAPAATLTPAPSTTVAPPPTAPASAVTGGTVFDGAFTPSSIVLPFGGGGEVEIRNVTESDVTLLFDDPAISVDPITAGTAVVVDFAPLPARVHQIVVTTGGATAGLTIDNRAVARGADTVTLGSRDGQLGTTVLTREIAGWEFTSTVDGVTGVPALLEPFGNTIALGAPPLFAGVAIAHVEMPDGTDQVGTAEALLTRDPVPGECDPPLRVARTLGTTNVVEDRYACASGLTVRRGFVAAPLPLTGVVFYDAVEGNEADTVVIDMAVGNVTLSSAPGRPGRPPSAEVAGDGSPLTIEIAGTLPQPAAAIVGVWNGHAVRFTSAVDEPALLFFADPALGPQTVQPGASVEVSLAGLPPGIYDYEVHFGRTAATYGSLITHPGPDTVTVTAGSLSLDVDLPTTWDLTPAQEPDEIRVGGRSGGLLTVRAFEIDAVVSLNDRQSRLLAFEDQVGGFITGCVVDAVDVAEVGTLEGRIARFTCDDARRVWLGVYIAAPGERLALDVFAEIHSGEDEYVVTRGLASLRITD